MELRGTRFGLAFIIFAVATGATLPSLGPFHHPAFRQRDQARAPHRPLLPFAPPSGPMLLEPRVQLMIVILAIAKDDSESREIVRTDLGEQFYGGGPILQPCTRDQDDEQQPDRVNPHMAFTPANFLASLISPFRTSSFRRLARLTVDAGRTGSRLAPVLDTYPRA